MDALIRECAVRTGDAVEPVLEKRRAASPEEEDTPFVPDMNDLLELAIAGKAAKRAALYRGLGPEFEAGYVALVQGEAPRAVELLRLASRKPRPTFVLHLELARALSMAGDMKAAREELEKAIRLSPSDLEASSLLAAVHIQLGDFEQAEAILAPLVDRHDAGPEPCFLLGRSMAGQGKPEDALARFREAVKRDSGFPDAYFEAGKLLKQEGDDRGALRLLRQACSILPEEIDYNRELAILVLERDLNVDTGLAACDRLMVTDEENRWEYLSWIAELYLRRGWRREATDPLRKAIDLIPQPLVREKLELEKRLAELEGESPPTDRQS
jgi:tetratricopeptide (TPR) repeat protein